MPDVRFGKFDNIPQFVRKNVGCMRIARRRRQVTEPCADDACAGQDAARQSFFVRLVSTACLRIEFSFFIRKLQKVLRDLLAGVWSTFQKRLLRCVMLEIPKLSRLVAGRRLRCPGPILSPTAKRIGRSELQESRPRAEPCCDTAVSSPLIFDAAPSRSKQQSAPAFPFWCPQRPRSPI